MTAHEPASAVSLRRDQIVDAALKVVARVGYDAATVREIAGAVGMSQAGVLHHFGSRDELLAEVLRRSDAFDVDQFGADSDDDGHPTDLAATFVRVVRHHQETPGLVRLCIQVLAASSEPDHPDRTFIRQRRDFALRIASDAFQRLQDHGEITSDLSPTVLAGLMLALQDGLRLQWLYDDTVDVPEHVTAFFRLLEPREAKPHSSKARTTNRGAARSSSLKRGSDRR